jgi:hypothetical protein
VGERQHENTPVEFVAIHPLEHPETRYCIGVAQPPAFYFVPLFAHARKRVTFPGRPKRKKSLLHNMLRRGLAASASTFFRDEPK